MTLSDQSKQDNRQREKSHRFTRIRKNYSSWRQLRLSSGSVAPSSTARRHSDLPCVGEKTGAVRGRERAGLPQGCVLCARSHSRGPSKKCLSSSSPRTVGQSQDGINSRLSCSLLYEYIHICQGPGVGGSPAFLQGVTTSCLFRTAKKKNPQGTTARRVPIKWERVNGRYVRDRRS